MNDAARAWEVSPVEAQRLLREHYEACVLLDCRTPEEHATARIEGNILIPMQEIGGRLEELREHEDKTIIVYCHHGVRSLKVTSLLRQHGFGSAVSMAGGIDRWSVEVDPGVPRY